MELHISIAAETVANIAGFPITNSLLLTWIVMLFLLIFSVLATRNLKMIPSGLQFLAELVVGGLYDFFEGVCGKEKIKELFPLIASIFIFVLVANWSGLLPGLTAIGVEQPAVHASQTVVDQVDSHDEVGDTHESPGIEPETASVQEEHEPETDTAHASFIPLLRGPTADLNLTFALAFVSVGAMVYFGIKHLGLGFFKRYLDFSNPIMTFVGFLEIISDISKLVSFAFRLFGNIFAGEVLLVVMGFLAAMVFKFELFLPLPFLALEIFIGFIQALVFAMLTAVFINIATTPHGDH